MARSLCLSDEDLRLYRTGHLPVSDLPRVADHLKNCSSCASRMTSNSAVGADTMAAGDLPRLERKIAQWAQNQGAGESGSSQSPPVADTSTPVPSISVEGYHVTRELARGGMGIIYDAIQIKLNRRVALKVLPATLGAAGEQAVSRFRHEATAAAKLHHTHIVPIYDFGQSGHTYYYAMELIDGLSLTEMIRRFGAANAHLASNPRLAELFDVRSQPLAPAPNRSEPESTASSSGTSFGSQGSSRTRVYYLHVARWMADAADALHYAHSQGIIHRDIKPGNLMLASDGRVMILDFGLAKSMNEMSVTTTGSLLGTLRYMSPEQAMAKRMKVDHRTDIYSLGATMYELLAFQPAFHGADEKETLGLIITKDATPLRKIISQVPRELETICQKTLEKDPGARYATAKDMADDLRRFIQDLPIVAKPVGPIGRTIKFVRRRRAASIAVTAIVGCVLIGAFAWRSNQAQKVTARDQRVKELMRTASDSIATTHTMAAAEKQKTWTTAERDLREVLELDPLKVGALVNLGIIKKDMWYTNHDDRFLVEATECFEKALQIDPDNINALNGKGVVLRNQNKLPDALVVHKRVTELKPNYYPAWVNLATTLATKRDFPEAENALRRATSLERKAVMPWHNLAAVLLQMDSAECLKAIDEALAIAPTDSYCHLLQAKAYLQLPGVKNVGKAYDAAITASNVARTGGPRARIARVLALTKLLGRNYPAALESAESAVRQRDAAPQALFIMAIAQANLGAKAEARRHFEAGLKALKEHPPHVTEPPESGFLWFESPAEVEALRREAEELVQSAASKSST